MTTFLKYGYLFTLLISIYGSGKAQSNYKDIVVSDNIVWALTNQGILKLFDGTTGNQIKREIFAGEDIVLITQDKGGNVVIANKRKEVKRFDQIKNTWKTIGNYDIEPSSILVNSKGVCFAITENGIQDLTTKEIYFDNKSLNYQINYRDKWGKPYCSYIDKNDIIWLGFGYGEWGGNLIAFQTIKNKFLELSIDSFKIAFTPIKSFCEDSTSLYISAGLSHMLTRGVIMKIQHLKAITVFESESNWLDEEKRDKMIYGEYIGPLAFNPYNNSIYFYSQNGIFLGEKSHDLSKIDNWTKVINPKLIWKYGQPDAVGPSMNVIKLCIVDKERFVFLSQNNGIGFYDGKKLAMQLE